MASASAAMEGSSGADLRRCASSTCAIHLAADPSAGLDAWLPTTASKDCEATGNALASAFHSRLLI
jgi:hypothetical protein